MVEHSPQILASEEKATTSPLCQKNLTLFNKRDFINNYRYGRFHLLESTCIQWLFFFSCASATSGLSFSYLKLSAILVSQCWKGNLVWLLCIESLVAQRRAVKPECLAKELELPTSVLCRHGISYLSISVFPCVSPPEGRPGMSDVSPLSGISGLSFDSTLLSPILFFCFFRFLFLSCLFTAYWPILLTSFKKILQYFSLRDWLFWYGSCLAARRW